MNENSKDGKNVDKQLIPNEELIHSITKGEIIQDPISNDNPEANEDNENIDNANEEEGDDDTKNHEEGISLKQTKTKDLVIQQKDPIESFRFRMIMLEAIIIAGIIGIAVLEISTGLKIYTKYKLIKSTYYYNSIEYYIRNLNYPFNFTINPTIGCDITANMSFVDLSQVDKIDGVCITTNPLKASYPNDATVAKYDLSFIYDNPTKCLYNSVILDTTVPLNNWANFYYCQLYYPQSYISFYFLNSINNTSCYNQDIQCGTKSGYLFCMYYIQNIGLTYCPYMTIVPLANYTHDNNTIADLFWINHQQYYLVRGISDKYNGFYFSFSLNYGVVISGYDNITLSSSYIDFTANSYIDFSVKTSYSIFNTKADEDMDGGFFNNFFAPVVVQSNTNTFGSINLPTPPYNFSIRYKQNYLPDPSCFDLLQSTDSTNTDFLNSIDLFLEHLEYSSARYVEWTILEITFVGIFYVYLRGFIIFNEWLGKITLKMDDVEMNNERYTEIEINLFAILIMTFKFMNNYVQLGNIANNLSIALNLNSRKCFKNDPYIFNSLLLYYDDVTTLHSFTQFSIYLMGIHFAGVIVFGIIKWIYLNKKKIYLEQEKLRQIDLKKTK